MYNISELRIIIEKANGLDMYVPAPHQKALIHYRLPDSLG